MKKRILTVLLAVVLSVTGIVSMNLNVRAAAESEDIDMSYIMIR